MNTPVKNIGGVFIVIPYYNEEKVIDKVIRELDQYNVILVDDGSIQPVEKFVFSKNLFILRHRVNLGQGAAIQTGFEFALKNGAAYIITFDADGQHDPADIPNLLLPLVAGEAELTLGSRFLSSNDSLKGGRRMLLKLARFVNYLFTGLFLSDAHNGVRAFSAEAAKRINLKENRMAHATEFLGIIKKQKIRFREVPVTVRYTAYSKKKGQSAFQSIRIFFDLVLHKLFE